MRCLAVIELENASEAIWPLPNFRRFTDYAYWSPTELYAAVMQ